MPTYQQPQRDGHAGGHLRDPFAELVDTGQLHPRAPTITTAGR